jgi:hypothetical protein
MYGHETRWKPEMAKMSRTELPPSRSASARGTAKKGNVK